MRIYVGLSVCTHMHTYVSISFSVTLYMRMYAQKLQLTHILSYNCHLFSFVEIAVLAVCAQVLARMHT